jgi:UDP-N-acetylglucosamine 2-epimerase (non-hydrolysing)
MTLKHNTERPGTLTDGTYLLTGTHKAAIIQHAFAQLDRPVTPNKPRFWDSHAG